MQTEIRYGDETIQLTLPDTTRVITLPSIQKRYEKETIRTALRKAGKRRISPRRSPGDKTGSDHADGSGGNPVDTGKQQQRPMDDLRFKEFLDGAESLLIIVNDAHRPTPTARILDHTYDKFLRPLQPRFIVACGSHAPPDEDGLSQIFGDWLDELRDNIVIHDSRDDDEMVEIGTAAQDGSPIELNHVIADHDSILVIGSIELHYFSGFTGGRKAFLPGIASFGTIQRNHENAMQENARNLALEGNPVHDGMEHATRLIESMGKRIFSVQCVLDTDGDIYAASAGNIHTSLMEGAKIARRIYAIESCERADIVIASVPSPMDHSLYHSHKAIENVRGVFADGATVILVSKCAHGIGPDTFVRVMESSHDPQEILNGIRSNYQLGAHKTAKILDLVGRYEMLAYSDLPEKELARVKFGKVNNLQKAIDDAIARKRSDGTTNALRIALIPDASNVCPTCSG